MNRRNRSDASSRLASNAFSASASACSSSRASGTGNRSPCGNSPAATRIRSTGRNDDRTDSQVAIPTSTATSTAATASQRVPSVLAFP